MSLFASSADRAVIGFDAGWRATFMKETDDHPDRDQALVVSRSGYEAEVRVSRSTSLRAPTFELSIDGLPAAELDRIIAGRMVFVEIALGWRDLAGSGVGALGTAVAGLFDEAEGTLHPVVVGRILDVGKSAGAFRERTTFRGIGAGFHRLETAPAPNIDHQVGRIAPELIERVARELVAVEVHRDGGLPDVDQPQTPDLEQTALDAVRDLARRGHAEGDDRELPVFFRVRPDVSPVDEVLHVGHWDEPIGARHDIDGSTGLAELRPVLDERRGGLDRDPFAAIMAADLEYDLVLLGRADIQAGDVVSFEVDELTGGNVLDSVLDTVGLSGLADGEGGRRGTWSPSSTSWRWTPAS
jgi:hypothetical protein